MTEESSPSKADWPQWAWRDSGWWLTAIGAVIAILVILYPLLGTYSLRVRLLAGLASLLSPILLLVIIYLYRVAGVIYKRVRGYDHLHKLTEQKSEEIIRSRDTITNLLGELIETRSVEIEKVQYFKKHLGLLLKKRRGLNLEVGNEVRVIDMTDGSVMGVFEISEARRTHYIAKSSGSIDAVWLGYIHGTGDGESYAPPNTAAISFPKDVNQHE